MALPHGLQQGFMMDVREGGVIGNNEVVIGASPSANQTRGRCGPLQSAGPGTISNEGGRLGVEPCLFTLTPASIGNICSVCRGYTHNLMDLFTCSVFMRQGERGYTTKSYKV